MKERLDNLVKLCLSNKAITVTEQQMLEVATEYGVSTKTVHNRCHSYYGMSIRNHIKRKHMPDHVTLTSMLLCSVSKEEFKELVNIPESMFKGIYDRTFNSSTYLSAKCKVMLMQVPVNYAHYRYDNKSLWYSQLLGDGSYCNKRHAFSIAHGDKQGEYLKWKVSLINKAYPKTPCAVTRHQHTQGHYYWRWYSKNIGNIDIPYLDRQSVIESLSPLGWLLWWLDDGGMYQDISIFSIEKAVCDEAIRVLLTFKIEARLEYGVGFTMCGGLNTVRFYKNFIEPFQDKIPACMKYKVEDIVEKYND